MKHYPRHGHHLQLQKKKARDKRTPETARRRPAAQDPSWAVGPWSEIEEERLKVAFSLYGNDATKIARYVLTRNKTEVQKKIEDTLASVLKNQ